jgi:hypothetical protein
MLLIRVAEKQNAKILENAKVVLLWISAAILNIRRHVESDKKKFFCEIFPTKIQAQIMKQNAKMFKTHGVMVETPVFQPF